MRTIQNILWSRRQLMVSAASAVGVPVLSWATSSAAAPTRLTKMVVPFAAGGGVDMVARALVQQLLPRYTQGLIVESRPGAAGRIAAEYVKAQPADGSTLMYTPDFLLTLYPHSYRKLRYDPLSDFAPVCMTAVSTLALSIGPAVPDFVKTVAQFVAWCKANPKRAQFASVAGGTPHFSGFMFARSAGIEHMQIPYKGGAPALQDTIGGQVTSCIGPVGEVLPYAADPRVRVLATFGRQRNSFLPGVPTMVECGYSDVVAEVWLGVVMPRGTPPATVAFAADAIKEAATSQQLKSAYALTGMNTVATTPEEMAATIRADLSRWGPVVRASGFSADD